MTRWPTSFLRAMTSERMACAGKGDLRPHNVYGLISAIPVIPKDSCIYSVLLKKEACTASCGALDTAGGEIVTSTQGISMSTGNGNSPS
jgi:hypothetical protein